MANTLLYVLIYNALLTIGGVKASVVATVITTTLSYFANRHWTYRSRPASRKRREYTLFFGFNLAGLVIQSGTVTAFKYGLGLTEADDRLMFNVALVIGVALATLFRFWSYRTLVFRPHPADHAAPAGAAEALAEVLESESEFAHLTAPLEDPELDAVEAELATDEPAGSASGRQHH